jgi:hypothetical protein
MTWSLPHFRTLRRLVHARYFRAVVTALALAAVGASAGIGALEARYDVSFQAVAGFFLRSHTRTADLSRLVSSPETIQQLEALYLQDLGVNPGGLVYEEDGYLTFYPHLTRRAEATRERHRDNHRIYPRLVRHYFESDVESLLGEMSSPAVLARLERDGVDPTEILELRARSLEGMPQADRRRLLQSAARHISSFSPLEREPYELSFADKLRFYEMHRPRGRFVGVFEAHGFGFNTAVDDAYASTASRYSHYLAVVRVTPGRFVVLDHYRGERREYLVRALRYPTGAVGEPGFALPAL